MKTQFLKLAPGYFALWGILLFIVASKVFLLRGLSSEAAIETAIFGVAMLAISYLGAWLYWLFSKKDQRKGELGYLAIIAVVFVIRTVILYGEGFATL